MSKTILLTILALIVAGYAFAADRQAQQANELRIKNITTQQAKELYLKPDHLLLDVRTLAEYQERHIEPSVLIPLQELEARYQELPKDKTILVICRSGNRSLKAIEILQKYGFTQLYNVQGGINAW